MKIIFERAVSDNYYLFRSDGRPTVMVRKAIANALAADDTFL